jgi:hypothetical protein
MGACGHAFVHACTPHLHPDGASRKGPIDEMSTPASSQLPMHLLWPPCNGPTTNCISLPPLYPLLACVFITSAPGPLPHADARRALQDSEAARQRDAELAQERVHVAQVGPRGGQGIWFLMATGSMGPGARPTAAGPPVRTSAGGIFPGR